MLGTYQELIENNPLTIATVTPENLPNIVIVAYAKIVDENKILITDNFMNQSKLDILNNPNVCLGVFDADWKGIKIIGQATYYETGEYLEKVKALPENDGLPAKGAILIETKKIIELH